MKRIIVFTAMFAACLAHLAAEEYQNRKCVEVWPIRVYNEIACVAQQCGGRLTFLGRIAKCSEMADVTCNDFVVPLGISYPAMSVSVPAGMGFCGENNDVICMPDFSNPLQIFGPNETVDCL